MPEIPSEGPAAPDARRVNNYELLNEIGSGGMSRVFRAHRLDTDETVAVKVIRIEDVAADYERRLRREPEVQQGLGHENIVRLIDWFRLRDEFFLVMEYIDGRSLAQIIHKDSGALPFERARAYFRQLLRAVNHLHSLGIVHRDIKPSNILIQKNDVVKLADFGIAKFTWQQGQTKTQKGLGTPEYMSPEQARGTQIDHRTDIYSLGITLFEVLTGRKPFSRDEETPMAYVEVIQDILTKPLPDPRQFRPGIPAGVVRLLNKATAKDPGDRFQSAGEFLGALEMIEEQDSSPATVVVGDLPGVAAAQERRSAAVAPPQAPVQAQGAHQASGQASGRPEPRPRRTGLLVALLVIALLAAGYFAFEQYAPWRSSALKPLNDSNAVQISSSVAADFQEWSRTQNSEAIATLYAEDSVDYLKLKNVTRKDVLTDIQKFMARITHTDQFEVKVRRATAVNDSTISTEWIITYQYQRNDGAILRGVTSNLLTLQWFGGDWLITKQAQNWIQRGVTTPPPDTTGRADSLRSLEGHSDTIRTSQVDTVRRESPPQSAPRDSVRLDTLRSVPPQEYHSHPR